MRCRPAHHRRVASGVSGARRRSVRAGALPLVVLAVTAALTAPVGRAHADGVPPDQLVAAVTAAYGGIGALAVVVAGQQERMDDLSVRAAEARSADIAASGADNGPA